MTVNEYSSHTDILDLDELQEVHYISESEISIKSKYPFSEYANTHMLPRNSNDLKKSTKTGTLLLIGIISTCTVMTAVVLPIPWNLMAIGFGGPIVTLVRRMLKK